MTREDNRMCKPAVGRTHAMTDMPKAEKTAGTFPLHFKPACIGWKSKLVCVAGQKTDNLDFLIM